MVIANRYVRSSFASICHQSGFSLRTIAASIFVMGMVFCSSATAQTAHFSGAQIALGGGFNAPRGIAVDISGNVYVADSGNNAVKEIPTGCLTSSCVVELGGSYPFNSPKGIGVDASGDVFVADSSANKVEEMTPNCTSSSCVTVLGGVHNFDEPTAVNVDAAGDVFVAQYAGGTVGEIPAGCTLSSCVKTIGSGFVNPDAVAVDASNNVFVTDNATGHVSEIHTVSTPYDTTTRLATGFAFNSLRGIALDSSGNLYVADSGLNAVEELTYASGYSTVVTLASNYNAPRGVAVDHSGNVYLGDYGNNAVEEVKTSNVSFGSINVGSTSSAVELIFTFDSTGTIEAPAVLAQGAANLDFKDTGNGTCTTNGTGHTYNSGDTCIVAATFTPQYPGPRYGAVQLLSSSGTLLATAYISGMGVGPQVTFLPGTQSTFASSSAPNNMSYPYGVAVDASENVYIVDFTNNSLYKETLSGGSYTQSVIDDSLSNPEGVAVDGSGNVYIANEGNGTITKETLSAGTYTPSTIYSGMDRPDSIAVDGSGNVYALDGLSNVVVKLTPSAGVYTPNTIISGLNNPAGIAVDGSGNLYISDFNNNQVLKETLSAGTYTASNMSVYIHQPCGIAVDGGGNVYFSSDYAGISQLWKDTLSGGSYSQSELTITGMTFANGLAMDGTGNLFIADGDDQKVLKVDYADTPSLTFGAATTVGYVDSIDGAQSVTVENVGNAVLAAVAPGMNVPGDFIQVAGSGTPTDCTAAFSLAAGSSCNISIEFDPTQSGSLSNEAFVLTDDSLNAAAATQSILLSGTGVAPPPSPDSTSTAVLITSGSLISWQTVSITATVSDTTHSGTTPSGSVIFYDYFGSSNPSPLNGGMAVALNGGLATLSSVILNGIGLHTIVASYSDGNSGATFQGNSGFGTVALNPSSNVGTTTSSFPVALTFTAAGTLDSISVLTQGAANLDFKDAVTGDTCSGNYIIGATCIVNVIFTPKYPGTRYGAVVLKDASGNLLATTYIDGTGIGAQVNFPPGTMSTLAQTYTSASGFNIPYGVAVDASGNVFVADNQNAAVKEILAAGGYTTVNTLAQTYTTTVGFNNPYGVALDGSGNVFVADGNAVKEILAAGGYTTVNMLAQTYTTAGGFNNPVGVAVDGNGNVFVGDNIAVKEILAAGGYTTVNTLAQTYTTTVGFNGAAGVAVDVSGNVFVADAGHNAVKEILVASGYTTVNTLAVANGNFRIPTGVTVDGNGNVFVADAGNSAVKEILAAGGYTIVNTIGSGSSYTLGVALDGRGNIFFADTDMVSNNAVKEIDFADPPNLHFPTPTTVNTIDTTDVPQSVTVENVGNAPLIFTSFGLFAAPDFQQTAGSGSPADCVDSGTVAAGASCNLSIEFAPVQNSLGLPTPLNENFTLYNNNLNSPSTPQFIGVHGTSTGVSVPVPDTTATAVTVTPSSFISGQTANISATVTDLTNSGTIPSGNVTFTDTVGSTTTNLNVGSPINLVSGVATLWSVTLIGTGTHTITATYAGVSNTFAGSSGSGTAMVTPSSNVGTAPASFPVTLTFTAAGTVGSVNVLTQGAPNLDFTDAVTGDTCSGVYIIGNNCTVYVTFNPKYPGARNGAVVLEDGSGNVLATAYVSGFGNGSVVGFAPGTINTVAGNYGLGWGYTGDGGQATSAQLTFPFGVALDGAGNLYICDQGNQVVREVGTNGVINTVAGNRGDGAGYSGDLGPATSAQLNYPQGIVLDGAGNLYIADAYNNVIRMVTPGGTITTVAGNHQSGAGYSGDGGQATSARINNPISIALDGAGNLYIADNYNQVIRKVTPAGFISTVAGNQASGPGYGGDGGQATSAQLNYPDGVAVDSSGNLYIADSTNNVIRKVTPGGVISTVAGNQSLGFGYSGDGGQATSAQLNHPYDVKLDAAGNLYIVDSYNGVVRKVTPGGIISTVAGLYGNHSTLGDGGPATSAEIFLSEAIAVDATGNLYISDAGDSLVRKVDVSDAPSLTFSNTNVGSTSAAQDLTVENLGNANLNFSQISVAANFNTQGADTTCATSSPVTDAATCILGIQFAPQSAGIFSGSTLVLTDNNLNVASATQSIGLSGTGVTAPADATSMVVAVSPGAVTAAQSVTITATVTDTTNSGTTPAGTVTFTDTVGSTTTNLNGGLPVSLVLGVAALSNVALSGSGTHTITVTYSDGNDGATFQSNIGTGTATVNPSSNVGTAPASFPVTVTFTAGGTVNSVNVLTQGAPNLDFTDAVTGDTCSVSTTYTIGNRCMVNVTFTPAFAGPRNGAVVLGDGSGNVLATAFISGTGNGPQLAFGAGTALGTAMAPTANGTPMSRPTGIAMDAAGDIFIADILNSRVIEMLAGGGAAQVIAPTVNGIPLNNPAGLAVDGAGDLFIADVYNWRVVEVPAVGGAAAATVIAPAVNGIVMNNPTAVAVDGAGDLFIADTWNNRIVEVSISSAPTAISPTVNGLTLNYPSGIAVDNAGNLFIADTLNNRVVEVPASGGAATAISPTANAIPLNYPSGIVVDGAGDLFIADTLNNRVVEVPGDGSAATAFAPTVNGVALVYPNGIMLDGAGDLFVADHTNSRVVELNRSQPPALSYASTAVGVKSSDSPQSVTTENIGTATMTFSGLTVAADFPLDSSGASVCTSATSLPAGARCVLPIDFTPATVGIRNEFLTLTSNGSLTAQNISLSGTATQATPTVTWPTASAITYGQTLASSTLSGGSASVAGGFAFTTPGTAPGVGTAPQSVTFTPTDATDYNSVTSTVSVTVNIATATVTLGSLAQTYTGSPLSATAITNPSGKTVTFTYTGIGATNYATSSTSPTAAGSYTVVGTISDPNYTGTNSGTLVISPATATVTLGSLAQAYTGSSLSATAITNPTGKTVTFTYTGISGTSYATSSTPPTAAGSYTVVGTINDPNYSGTATGTLLISPATATVTLGSLAQSYTGSPLSATAITNPFGKTVTFTYTGIGATNYATSSTSPTAAGSYTVVCTISDPNYSGTNSGTLVISPAPATVTLGSLAQSYTGSPLSATAVTNPAGKTVTFTYTGISGTTYATSSTPPSAAGSYTVVATISSGNYAGTATGTLVISPATTTVTLGSLAQTYTGSPLSATAITNPAGKTVTFTYTGISGTSYATSSAPPSVAGSYTVVGTISDPNYSGTNSGTLVISPATATVTLSSLAQSYTGSPLSATAITNPTGKTVTFTYTGISGTSYATSSTPPSVAGSYTVVGTISDPNYSGTNSGTLVISPATATVTLGSLAQTYTGSALSATAITNPSGKTVTFTYTGISGTNYATSSAPPTAAGSYTVVGTISSANYAGTATGTLVIGQIASGVSVASNTNPALVTSAITFTATVSSKLGAPTGTVTFLDGTTLLGQGTLSGDVATLISSSLAAGSHTITAVYSGDTNFVASTSGTLTQSVLNFSLNPVAGSGGSGTSQTVSPGGDATYSLTIVPSVGTVFPTPVTLTVSGMPAGATAIITPSSWTQLNSTSWLFPANTPMADISLAIQLPSTTASLDRENLFIRKLPAVLLGLLLLPFASKLRRTGKRLGRTVSLVLFLVAGMAAMAGLSGCGSTSGSFSQQQGTYSVVVTATSGTLSHSTTITLIVE